MAVRWQWEIKGKITIHRPLVVDGAVIVGSEFGALHAFRLADGSQAWSHDFGEETRVRSLAESEAIL